MQSSVRSGPGDARTRDVKLQDLSFAPNSSASRVHQRHNIREVYSHRENDFKNNRIKNTKYTVLNFVPKNLMLQFGHHMNRYFLLIALLQLWPEISPVNPITTWGPLLFIFTLSAVKEAFDDYHRYLDDCKANQRKCEIVRRGMRQMIASEDIHVGDIVIIRRDEEVPCDIVLLKSSDQTGTCYIQTSNIDGETNLKDRIALDETQGLSDSEVFRITCKIECSHPNNKIYSFDSTLSMRVDGVHKRFALNSSQLIPQATSLRNTDYVYGLTVYTGDETKLGQNKKVVPDKWTVLDKKINRTTVFIFSFMILVILALGISGNVWKLNNYLSMWFLDEDVGIWWKMLVIPLRFFLLSSMMIPISLKVSLDLARLFYALLINWDIQMYDAQTDTPSHAVNTTISEDLGQISYILTDKTGTLTENLMVFKMCTIGEIQYGEDDGIYSDMQLRQKCQSDEETVLFFEALALCNTVVPCHTVDGRITEYNASSPDEEALVKAAVELGVSLTHRNLNEITLDIHGYIDKYDILQVLPFDSDRKRMSILLRNQTTRRIHLFSKGADDMIFTRLSNKENGTFMSAQRSLDAYSRRGLRTLCIAHRYVEQKEYETWAGEYEAANCAIVERQDALNKVYEDIEHSLDLLGVTGVEDRLQDQVPETINCLRKAGIRFWMLTGDKKQTAVEIGRACQMISQNGQVLQVNGSNRREIEVSLRHNKDLFHQSRLRGSDPSEYSLVIGGHELTICLDYYARVFSEICAQCHTVICCRVTPAQKAAIVAMVKERGHVTLAIGDGGNDIGMIQEAHIGVGISGREGLQAARAADYSFARFRFLTRLCLIHGRYSNNRTAFISQYCFYKSMFICLLQLIFSFLSGFSGASLFDSFSLVSYNMFYTSLPPMLYCLEKDLQERTIVNHPELYDHCQSGRSYSARTMVLWFIRASLQAFFIGYTAFSSVAIISVAGQDGIAMLAYSSCVVVQVCTMALETTFFTAYNHAVIWGTLILFFVLNLVLGTIPALELYHIQITLIQDSGYWLTIFVTAGICMFPVVVVKFVISQYYPDIAQMTKLKEQTKTKDEDETSLLSRPGTVLPSTFVIN